MDGKREKWSRPDYEGWRHLVAEVRRLPLPKFYFVTTLTALVGVAYFVRTSLPSVAVVSSVIAVFSITVLITQWKRETNGREDEAAELEVQSNGREETEIADEDVRRG